MERGRTSARNIPVQVRYTPTYTVTHNAASGGGKPGDLLNGPAPDWNYGRARKEGRNSIGRVIPHHPPYPSLPFTTVLMRP